MLLRKWFWEKKAQTTTTPPHPPNSFYLHCQQLCCRRNGSDHRRGQAYHRNYTQQLGHSLTCPGNSNWSCSGSKEALALRTLRKPLPKTQSRAMLCYQRPPCPSPYRPASAAATNLLSKTFVGHCQPPQELASKATVPLPDVTSKLPQRTGPCTEHRRHEYLQKPFGGCPSSRANHGRSQHGCQGSQERCRKQNNDKLFSFSQHVISHLRLTSASLGISS